jgi:hypothetical protein
MSALEATGKEILDTCMKPECKRVEIIREESSLALSAAEVVVRLIRKASSLDVKEEGKQTKAICLSISVERQV